MESKTVLIIEGDKNLCRLLKILLQNSKHKPIATPVNSLKNAKQVVEKEIGSVDVVLLDGNIDSMVTTPLFNIISSSKPVIVMSGNPNTINEFREIGCKHTLSKPFTIQELLAEIDLATTHI